MVYVYRTGNTCNRPADWRIPCQCQFFDLRWHEKGVFSPIKCRNVKWQSSSSQSTESAQSHVKDALQATANSFPTILTKTDKLLSY